jgi:tetratricopeptide (TPR) repeat protein
MEKSASGNVILILWADDHFAQLREPNRSRDGEVNVGGTRYSCTLADENANVYGGAPFAMPVRLLVSEDQVDEAKKVFQDAEKLARSDATERGLSMEETVADISDELKKLRSKVETNTTLVVLLFAGLAFYIFIEMKSSSAPARSRQSQVETWRSASTALDNMDYAKATEIAQRLTDKNPTYYYGYYYLGYIALQRNHLKEAEGYFARAYELFPTSDNEQRLQAVRKQLEIEHSR